MGAAAEQLGAVPRRLLWDNEAGIGRRGRLAEGVAGFTGTLATRLVQASRTIRRPRGSWSGRTGSSRPRSCPAGRSHHRRTSTPSWRIGCRSRTSGGRAVVTGAAGRSDRSGPGRDAAVAADPAAAAARSRIRLGRDYFVRIAGSDYSVDPVMIGRMVDVTANLDEVTVTADGRLVAHHAGSWACGDDRHRPDACRGGGSAARRSSSSPTVAEDPLRRDLADYDRAFGVSIDGQVA